MKRAASRAAVTACALLLVLGFHAIYYHAGMPLLRAGAFERFDFLFGADVPRVIEDLTDPSGNHYRSSVHPLFVLAFNPLGSRLAAGMDAARAALVLTTFAGAAAVALLLVYLLRLGLGLGPAALLALLYGCSASQLVWSAVPETYAFAALGLIALHGLLLAALEGSRRARLLLPLGGVLALGVTVTNFAQAVAGCLVVAARAPFPEGAGSRRDRARWLLATLAIALAATVALNLLQARLHPSAPRFFRPGSQVEELDYIHLGRMHLFDVARRISPDLLVGLTGSDRPPAEMTIEPQPSLAESVFTVAEASVCHALIAPRPALVSVPDGRSIFRLVPGRGYGALDWIALVAWMALLAMGTEAGWRTARPLLVLLLACVACGAGLHVVYNTRDAFLYTPHTTFLLVAIAGLGVRDGAARGRARLGLALALVLIVLAVEVMTGPQRLLSVI